MVKIDTDTLTPTQRQELIHKLREDQRQYEQENILKVKAEFQAMALERGFTLGQLNLAGKKSRAGVKLGPRKTKKEA